MSRKEILKSLEDAPFKGPSLPDYNFGNPKASSLLAKFTASAKISATQIVEKKDIVDLADKYPKVINLSSEIAYKGLDLSQFKSPYELVDIDLVILDGVFGVAENGAIWVESDGWPFRVLPFITEHLVICIKKENLVDNMHDAYAKIEADEYDFGVFIAGPSKTADIEQSLVIGAQGPRSMGVLLV